MKILNQAQNSYFATEYNFLFRLTASYILNINFHHIIILFIILIEDV